MPRAVTIASMAFRLLWIIGLILGALIAGSVVPDSPWIGIHMAVGIVLIALLWFLGVAVGLQTQNALLPFVTFLVGLLVAIIGASQPFAADGSATKYVLQGTHVVLILAAIALAEVSARRYKRARAQANS